ncbi:serine hydrolase domain-containing protein [Kitasatospora sp. NPDC056651]|uniref:serine hydrolase domain-containing protein n=1 Tax=Kitasatospora sp. NPDC056651 TaxID=3345892 RepID=UPI00369D06A3
MTEAALWRVVGRRADGEAHAVLVRLTGSAVQGGSWTAGSGTADLATGEPIDLRHRFRIGGVTKTFVATVVLQLAAEGRIGLDDPVSIHLPDLVRRPVTVRQLLNHTSGLADEGDVRYNDTGWFLRHRLNTFTPEQRVARALRLPLLHPPGTRQQIARANYDLAGLLIDAVTGGSYRDEVEHRLLRPLGLTGTSLPGTDPTLPQPHLRGYDAGVDVTEQNPSIHGAAGEMVSTLPDLDRFLTALVGGELLPAEVRRVLFEVPAVPYLNGGGMAHAGAGLDRLELPNGVVLWGMAGIVHGTLAGMATTPDLGRRLGYVISPTVRGTMRVPPMVHELVAAAYT